MAAHECKHEETLKSIKKTADNLVEISIQPFVRNAIIGTIGFLFLLYGGMWAYSATTYATKEELKESKDEVREGIREILKELRKR